MQHKTLKILIVFNVILCAIMLFILIVMRPELANVQSNQKTNDWLLKRIETTEAKLKLRNQHIEVMEKTIQMRDLQIKQLYNDTLRIHTFYNSGHIPRSVRDSLRIKYNPR